ncbi:MAG TPA: hypothetical protein VI454_05285, partial [Verrucomicrobiae bacterium]
MILRAFCRLALGGLLFVSMPAAWAFRHADHEELPNFEKRVPAAPTAAESAAKENAAAELGRRVAGVKVHTDSILGVPRWVGSTEGFLSGPKGMGKGISAAGVRAVPANDPHRTIKAFVHEHSVLFGHGVQALDRARVER